MASKGLQNVLHQLVKANHILHYHGAVDGFGHISVRHPERPNVYVMCGYMPPALVQSEDDLIEYYVNGSDPVDKNAKNGYSERFIHGELFNKYPSIQCVVHSHAEAVLPYVSSTVPLKPMFHMGGFLGTTVPVWDIAPVYDEDYQQDMLVNNAKLGNSLASSFAPTTTKSDDLEHNVVLMKRHGYTTWGKDIPTAVYRAIYTLINAGLQTKAAMLQATLHDGPLEGLSERHCRDCQKMNEATQDKSWRLWSREVEVNPIYRNDIPA
ncbi:hypothetical protein PRZ48_000039 [Zasmidium cellare]|uniref:Class II aldolase/adducin N-terminal domain-containing protein n=1 Tax=Zasmidium cellare TaxID=395010 RepID=A0ABR0EY55_ZASCE|nr:hypothetical protein PRZ48_000039 [Zasmidium cellare]